MISVPEDVLRARIDADRDDPGARGWRQRHVADALRELDGLAEREPDTIEVDNASRPPELVAKEILERLLIGSG